jgi:adenylate cyclase
LTVIDSILITTREAERYDPGLPVGRYIRYWYTYRTAVAIVIAVVLSGVIYALYTQQVACDTHAGACLINISVHPEDRLIAQSNPDPNVVIVGVDDASVSKIGVYPVPRDRYAQVLRNLQAAGAAVVAFDVGFPDPRETKTDDEFAKALAESTIPVVLSYGADNTRTADGRVIQIGIDQIPLKKLRCTDASPDPNLACKSPTPNVALGSTDVVPDSDGVVRRIPMFVEPRCLSDGRCDSPIINPLSFATYRAFVLGKDFQSGATLQESGHNASFGTAWGQPLQVDDSGLALVNYFGPPRNYQQHGQYLSFGNVWDGTFSHGAVSGKIVLVGYYYLTGVHDEVLTPTSVGTQMPGVELHANVIQMMLGVPPKFLVQEPPLVVFLTILILALLMAVAVARVRVLWGLIATGVALVAFTVGMAILANNAGLVPDLFHAWLAIALTYTGVTAYRFLYEDREKRKVTRIFGHYLKPEIVAQLARTRGGVDDILRGGERRDMTLLFVDIRGFTSMSESMAAHDVTEVVQMYLDHLSGIIFTWDGTVDKYVGDEIVAFWNAPRMQENHALLALRCAYDLVNRAPELEQRLLAKGLPPIRWGIGINTGPAVVGNMGSRSRLQYTALGDTVNTAARFCAHAPAFHVLIGQVTYNQCKDYIAVDLVPGVQLKGKSAETFSLYQVTAIRENTTSPWVPFPTEAAIESHHAYTLQYTGQTLLATGDSGPHEILVGKEAEQAISERSGSPN